MAAAGGEGRRDSLQPDYGEIRPDRYGAILTAFTSVWASIPG